MHACGAVAVAVGAHQHDIGLIGAALAEELDALAAGLQLGARRHVELGHCENESQTVQPSVQAVELKALLLAALAHLVEARFGVVVQPARPVHVARVAFEVAT